MARPPGRHLPRLLYSIPGYRLRDIQQPKRGRQHVGIAFNLHHGRPQLDDLPRHLALMKPHLLALNLNGTMSQPGPDAPQPHIVPLGQGDRDIEVLHAVAQCGWHGPVGVLCHSAEVDAEHRLLDNLEGLRWLRAQLRDGAPGPRPVPRTWPEH